MCTYHIPCIVCIHNPVQHLHVNIIAERNEANNHVQDRIKPAREHATTHVQYIDGEIQTWWSYSKNSSIRICIFMTQKQEKVTESHEVDKNEAVCWHTFERDD